MDNIKRVATVALEVIEGLDDHITNDEAIKGLVLAVTVMAKSLTITKESFFAGMEAAWSVVNVDDDAAGEAA